ncbi:MAG: futalosine hydrolase [Desulfobacula sp.]|nr:futalosine hydrolase [Desulfobacula sp.]
MNPDLLILCATVHEISKFFDRYPSESEIKSRSGVSVFSGKMNQKTYDLILTGAGVFNAAHALTAYLEQRTPGFILQTGIAGIFELSGLLVGDVAVATQEHYIHTGVQSDSITHAPLPFDLIKGHPPTRQGIYLLEKGLLNQCYKNLVIAFKDETTMVGRGNFITVSTITASKESAVNLYASFSPVMEAMEGAASAHMALLYDIPFVEVRSASNFVGQRDKSKWDIQKAAQQIPKICSAVSLI